MADQSHVTELTLSTMVKTRERRTSILGQTSSHSSKWSKIVLEGDQDSRMPWLWQEPCVRSVALPSAGSSNRCSQSFRSLTCRWENRVQQGSGGQGQASPVS